MSTDYNVHCLDCKSTHTFSDANHMDGEMAFLCKYKREIAFLHQMMADPGRPFCLKFHLESYGDIDTEWFFKHQDHRLVPISEYGSLMDQCHEYVRCSCGAMHQCTLDFGHAESHTMEPRK